MVVIGQFFRAISKISIQFYWSEVLVAGNDASSSISGQESNKVSEVEVEIQLTDLKDVYNKKTKKTDKGLKYCLEDSLVTVVAEASDEITSIRAYTQRCVEAAIRTHDTVGRITYNVFDDCHETVTFLPQSSKLKPLTYNGSR